MGMDVMGKNPTSEQGEYFRRNVWGWHPLWEYCTSAHPELANKVEYGHSNDGSGLDAADAAELGNLLAKDVKSGTAAQYVKERDAALAKLPRLKCEYCKGTGVRSDAVGVKMGMPEKGTCNACNPNGDSEHKGSVADSRTHYYLDVDDVKEFAQFLRECGGFEIW